MYSEPSPLEIVQLPAFTLVTSQKSIVQQQEEELNEATRALKSRFGKRYNSIIQQARRVATGLAAEKDQSKYWARLKADGLERMEERIEELRLIVCVKYHRPATSRASECLNEIYRHPNLWELMLKLYRCLSLDIDGKMHPHIDKKNGNLYKEFYAQEIEKLDRACSVMRKVCSSISK